MKLSDEPWVRNATAEELEQAAQSAEEQREIMRELIQELDHRDQQYGCRRYFGTTVELAMACDRINAAVAEAREIAAQRRGN